MHVVSRVFTTHGQIANFFKHHAFYKLSLLWQFQDVLQEAVVIATAMASADTMAVCMCMVHEAHLFTFVCGRLAAQDAVSLTHTHTCITAMWIQDSMQLCSRLACSKS